jgi:hypothetical protein
MAKRPHPRGTTTNPHAVPWTTCDRCGRIYSMNRMEYQTAYVGGQTPENLGLLVCNTCLDSLNYQNMLLILPPDPAPFFDTRPEAYAVDETSWLTTQSGDIIDTEGGSEFITQIPNPSDTPVAGADTIVEEAAINITTEDGSEIVSEQGDGNPIDIQPNPLP